MESYRQSRPFHRLMRRIAATRLMARIYAVIQTPLDRLVYRLTRGSTTASSWLGGVEITMLSTTGAKTGSTRTSPVLCIPDGEDTILIASNYGRPHNPSWYYNLRAHPYASIVTAGTSREVVAEELSGRRPRAQLPAWRGDLPWLHALSRAGRRGAGSPCSGSSREEQAHGL